MKICPCGGVCVEYEMKRKGVVVGFVAKCRACGRREEFLFKDVPSEPEEREHGPAH